MFPLGAVTTKYNVKSKDSAINFLIVLLKNVQLICRYLKLTKSGNLKVLNYIYVHYYNLHTYARTYVRVYVCKLLQFRASRNFFFFAYRFFC